MPCTNCMTKFSVLKKEHGCSNCGYSFCQKCLNKKFMLPGLSPKPLSVCDGCYKSLTGETVSPLEKTRGESNSADSNWWGSDEKPPPSMRHMYPIKTKTSNDKGQKKTQSDIEKDAELAERLAKIMNRTADEVRNPQYIVSDKDEGDIPSSSHEILSNLRQPHAPTSGLTNISNASNDSSILNLPKPPPDQDSIEGLEERLAILRNVSVDVIRKPRLMVMDDDSEPELNDDAKNLLATAEQKLRKHEPDIFCENQAFEDSDNEK